MNLDKVDFEALYEEHKNLIYKAIHKCIAQNDLPMHTFEELLSVANLYFVIVAHRYNDKNRAEFSTLLHSCLWGYLNMYVHKEKWEWEKLHFPRERVMSNKVLPSPIWLLSWWDELSTDSRILVGYVCKGDLDLNLTINKRTHSTKYVFRFLRKLGWKRQRINKCFKNIGKLLK